VGPNGSKPRTYRDRRILLPAVLVSIGVQAAAFVTYQITLPIPDPALTIRLDGEGRGTVLVTKVGDTSPMVRCVPKDQEMDRIRELPIAQQVPATAQYIQRLVSEMGARSQTTKQIVGSRCRVELPPGTQVRLTAVLDEEATFEGYAQSPMRPPAQLRPYLGDPLATCLDFDAAAMARGEVRDVMECPITLTANTEVAARFGLVPKEVDVAFANDEVIDEILKPAAQLAPPTPIDAEKLEEKPLEVAIAPPPPEVVKPPPPIAPPPPPPQEKEQKKPEQPPPNMVMVEVKDDKSVVDKAPDDATKLSDKNRDVAEESRAKETNLDKESEGKQVASVENDSKSTEIGGPDDKIRQLEETTPTTDQRIDQTDHSGESETAKGVIVGEGGENGEDGTGEREPGVLSMRGIAGRGSVQDQGRDGRKAGRKGTIGVNTPLSFQDYERIMGKDKVDEERHVAARKMSAKKGRWEKKLAAIKSSLENFVPDVRTGNQTALKTRAHPFAVYVARMHRRIHELWGFGFLEALDDRGASDPLNNPDLWTNLEVSVNPDGTLHKVTIVKTSGETEFDVAAIDTVMSSAPFEAPPEAIRSSDDRVYLRWGFYRNWRQCGTFNVEPYILTDIPKDSDQGVLDDSALVKNTAKLPGKKKLPPVTQKPVTPDDGKANQRVSPSSSVKDKEALFAANLWVSAFATASVDKLVKLSTVPFYAGGKVAAQTTSDLHDMYAGLVVESGAMRDWKLLSPNEYTNGGSLPEGNFVLQVRTAKEAFALVLTRTKSGDYRATQLAR
jgi:outer membrane biosynthesis protein TonB